MKPKVLSYKSRLVYYIIYQEKFNIVFIVVKAKFKEEFLKKIRELKKKEINLEYFRLREEYMRLNKGLGFFNENFIGHNFMIYSEKLDILNFFLETFKEEISKNKYTIKLIKKNYCYDLFYYQKEKENIFKMTFLDFLKKIVKNLKIFFFVIFLIKTRLIKWQHIINYIGNVEEKGV